MKIKLLAFSSILFFAIASCTNTEEQIPDAPAMHPDPLPAVKEEEMVTIVEIKAFFPAGETAWQNYIKTRMKNFNAAKNGAPAGEYNVILDLTIDKEGIITDAKALSNHGYGIEDKVISIVKKAPKWHPASSNGRNYISHDTSRVTILVKKE